MSKEVQIIIFNLLVVFILKVLDNILTTGKTILIQKNKGLLAAVTVGISQVIFYKLINVIGSSGDNLALYTVATASSIGTYLAIIFNNKFSRDKLFVNVILSDNKEEMIKLREYLMNHKINNLATDGYTKEWEKTIAITAYVETKKESKLLDKYLNESENKFKRIITAKE